MTIEIIRAALPTHIMLPKQCKTKHADSVCTTIVETGMIGGEIQYAEVELLAREIPSDILDNQAFWLLFSAIADSHNISESTMLQRWATEMSIADELALGGASKVRETIKFGRLYDKWLLAQIEGT